ncbi:MAG TPA: DRTGG domain-containing protein [Clostridia bacterium]|nr:DRTGG domain-containing protein [Clostridia bacterium]
MQIKEIAKILNGKIICCQDCVENEVFSACGSDMMSDVLAYVKEQAVLVTGLCNPQVVRTAEMMDIKCIVLVRDKQANEIMISLAKDHNIVIICTSEKMFDACGKLYAAGLNGSL